MTKKELFSAINRLKIIMYMNNFYWNYEIEREMFEKDEIESVIDNLKVDKITKRPFGFKTTLDNGEIIGIYMKRINVEMQPVVKMYNDNTEHLLTDMEDNLLHIDSYLRKINDKEKCKEFNLIVDKLDTIYDELQSFAMSLGEDFKFEDFVQ